MEFKWYTYGEDGLLDGFNIRREVFCREIGFTEEFEFDKEDRLAMHLVCYDNGVAVCNARILQEYPGVWHFGRLRALKEYRGKGYGKAAVLETIRKCEELCANRMILGAKYDKKEFYESLGFVAYGEIFHEEGIPHIMMEKEV